MAIPLLSLGPHSHVYSPRSSLHRPATSPSHPTAFRSPAPRFAIALLDGSILAVSMLTCLKGILAAPWYCAHTRDLKPATAPPASSSPAVSMLRYPTLELVRLRYLASEGADYREALSHSRSQKQHQKKLRASQEVE